MATIGNLADVRISDTDSLNSVLADCDRADRIPCFGVCWYGIFAGFIDKSDGSCPSDFGGVCVYRKGGQASKCGACGTKQVMTREPT